MKVRVTKKLSQEPISVPITTEFIKLQDFLKFANVCESGGMAKTFIQNEQVQGADVLVQGAVFGHDEDVFPFQDGPGRKRIGNADGHTAIPPLNCTRRTARSDKSGAAREKEKCISPADSAWPRKLELPHYHSIYSAALQGAGGENCLREQNSGGGRKKEK